jgi:signal transduction histidine kinase
LSCLARYQDREKESARDRFNAFAEKMLQRLLSHREGSHCSYANVWSYDTASGRLQLIASTSDDPRQAGPKSDLLPVDSVPASLFRHLDHHYRGGVTPPPVQYLDGMGTFVLILPTAQRDGKAGFSCLFHNDLIAYTEADLDVLYLLSESLVDRFHTSEYHDSLQQEIRRGEKQRIARDLHDTIVQDATGAVLQLENASLSLTETSADEARQHLLLASGLTRSVVEQLRKLIWSLHDSPDESGDATEEVRESFVQRAISVTQKIMKPLAPETGVYFSVSGEEFLLPGSLATELACLLTESLNNVVKHAGASRVDVRVSFQDSSVQILITDNGRGFDKKSPRRMARSRRLDGFGMIGMRERAEALGGKLTVSSSPGKGTRVRITLPGLTGNSDDQ